MQARQKGRCIFSTTISFQIPAKAVLNHSLDYPGRSLPQPETVPDFVEQAKSMYKKGVLSKADYENAAEIEKISPVEARAIVRGIFFCFFCFHEINNYVANLVSKNILQDQRRQIVEITCGLKQRALSRNSTRT